jgi:hypothetical protein
MKRKIIGLFLAAATTVLGLAFQAPNSRVISASPPQGVRPPRSLRLYVFDCGILHNSDAARYRFKKEEYHYDHTANANEFAGATWLVRRVEREAMFAERAPGTTQPSTYSALRASKTIILGTDEHDVFGDGTVIVKSAPGHTPGHQVLYLKLPKTGGVMLSGDLYHYPEERKLDRVPTFDFNEVQTRASRVMIEGFLKRTGAQLWIQHDIIGNAKLKKSPDFYD